MTSRATNAAYASGTGVPRKGHQDRPCIVLPKASERFR